MTVSTTSHPHTEGETKNEPCTHKGRCVFCYGVDLTDLGHYDFTGPITDATVYLAKQSLRQMAEDRKHTVRPNLSPDITLRLESGGGSVTSGMAFYSLVREISEQYGIPVTVRVDGMAASMAMTILQAGVRRIVSPNAFLMIHAATSGGAYETSADMRDRLKLMDAIMERMATIYAERNTAGLTDPSYWLKEMDHDKWMTPQEALEIGLVDGVR